MLKGEYEMKKYNYDLIVIGCGPAGQRAAVQAAKVGKRAAIVDDRESVGGVCVNSGTIPSKSFKEAVLFLSGFRQRNFYGDSYRVKSKIEMHDLTLRCQQIINTEVEVIKLQLTRNDVTVLDGEAKFVDPHTVEITSRGGGVNRKTAGAFVIATGAKPFHPPGFKFDGKLLFDSDSILSLMKLPESLTVVGAGVIGTEYGSMFAALGVDVTIVDGRKNPLPFLDSEITEGLQFQMRTMGVTFRLGEEVQRCEEDGRGRMVTSLKSGKVITSDCVLYSAGRHSATGGLGLEAIGVKLADRGRLDVNEQYQTSIPHIYGAGDVIGFPALDSTCARQGRLAACHAFNVKDEPKDLPMPYGIYSIPEVSFVGITEQQATEQGIPYETGLARYREITRSHILGDHNGLLKLLFHRKTEALLGIHIVGESATELIHIGQAVLSYGGGISYFLDAVFNYPTLAECYKVAALNGYNKLRKHLKVKNS